MTGPSNARGRPDAAPFDHEAEAATVADPAKQTEYTPENPLVETEEEVPVADQVDDGSGAGLSDEETWNGDALKPYEVGDPGRAAREVVPPLPDNPNDPADTQVDGATIGSLTVRAASSRGQSHRHVGTPRQDEYAICAGEDQWLIAAVADGVSAGRLSHWAARLASRTAADLVRESLRETGDIEAIPWTDVLGEVAGRIVNHGVRLLREEGSADAVTPADVPEAMATTLVVAAVGVTPAEDGTRSGVVLALGDTSVFMLGADGWSPVTAVKNEGADIASSATVALPYLPTEQTKPIAVTLAEDQALFVMTDGVGDPLGRGDGVVGEFLAAVWKRPPDILSFAAQVGFARRSFDDDRTVVGIWTES